MFARFSHFNIEEQFEFVNEIIKSIEVFLGN